jgi:hypothetical protein
MNKLLICLFFPLSVSAQVHYEILVSGIKIENQYRESIQSDLIDSAGFFTQFEQILKTKLGDLAIHYQGGKELFLIDPASFSSFYNTKQLFQQYYLQLSKAKKSDYKYLVEVSIDITDKFKSSENKMQIISTVFIKDKLGKVVNRKSGKVSLISPLPMNDGASFLSDSITVLSAFPVRKNELTEAILHSIALSFEDNRQVERKSAGRDIVKEYDEFIKDAIRYRVLVRNNFLRDTDRTKLFDLLTFTPKRNLLVTRVNDRQNGMLIFKESKFTDISFTPIGRRFLKIERFQRNFNLGVTMPGIPNSQYKVRASFINNSVRHLSGKDQIELKLKGENDMGELFFKTGDYFKYNSITQFTRSSGRVFHPHASLSGTIANRKLEVISNPACYNAVEIKMDGELKALITHPLTTKRYLRKERQYLAFILFLSPNLTTIEESLVLQLFNFNRLAYLMKNNQDLKLSKQR